MDHLGGGPLVTAGGHLGPDRLRDDWDIDEAVRRVTAEPDRALVAALLDQRCVAGFGNLWANELCYLRGHSPWTPVRNVDVHALLQLRTRALRHSATVPGAMQVTTGIRHKGEQHWVAGRAGRPCLRCPSVNRERVISSDTQPALNGRSIDAHQE